jgi:hypothetical protein
MKRRAEDSRPNPDAKSPRSSPLPSPAPPAPNPSVAAAGPATQYAPEPKRRSRGRRRAQWSWTTKLGIVFVLLLIAGGVGWKWYHRGRRLTHQAQAGSVASVAQEEPEAQQPIWIDDRVMLTIKHTNEMDIARACVDFWQERLRKQITLIVTNELLAGENQIGMLPANRGFVEIMGGLDWPKVQFEELTQYLSERFNTLTLVTRSVGVNGAYLFAVFEQGAKRFRVEKEVPNKGDSGEVVKIEGDGWALTHGYKPKQRGAKEFHLRDADKLARRIGVNLGARKENQNYLLFVESGGPLPTPVLKRPIRRAR